MYSPMLRYDTENLYGTLVQDRVPGEQFVPKPAKEAEMEKIMRSMEVCILPYPFPPLSFIFKLPRGSYQYFTTLSIGSPRSTWNENVF